MAAYMSGVMSGGLNCVSSSARVTSFKLTLDRVFFVSSFDSSKSRVLTALETSPGFLKGSSLESFGVLKSLIPEPNLDEEPGIKAVKK